MTTPGPSTASVHLTGGADPATGAIVPPIVANAAFAYGDLDEWRAVALGETEGDIYSRNSNPTTRRFEQKVAALEGAEAATSFATGMAAISTTLFALTRSGSRVVTVRDAYGGTYLLFTEILSRFGIEVEVCATDDHDAIETAIARGCDIVYLESPTNPTLKVVDIARLAGAAHEVGAIVLVDNTFATPINQRPIELGADGVLHSATKFLGGHGDVLGGVLCGDAALVERVYRYREIVGPALDASAAALLLRSLKTLGLRIERQNANAPRNGPPSRGAPGGRLRAVSRLAIAPDARRGHPPDARGFRRRAVVRAARWNRGRRGGAAEAAVRVLSPPTSARSRPS